MARRDHRPLLFLDVDGPLIPFGMADPGAREPGIGAWDGRSNPLLGRLVPGHGARLRALGCDLAWATSWMADANEEIAPRLGLPQLPVVVWPEGRGRHAGREVHGKTQALVAWAAGRPFVWVDDEITEIDRSWVSRHHSGDALLYGVDPRVGLTDADFDVIGQWLDHREAPK